MLSPVNRTERHLTCSPEDVVEVLADGWAYASWVVGAARVRAVDPQWPQPGSRIHHSVGVWPALLHDSTEALEWSPPHRLRLSARGWPAGEAEVVVEIEPDDEGCRVVLLEDASAGPGRLVPAPLRHLLLEPRNRESLRRLAFLAERRRDRPPE